MHRSPESWSPMFVAVLVVASLWIIAAVLVLASTRKPAEVADLVLASPSAPVVAGPVLVSSQERLQPEALRRFRAECD